MALGLEAPKSAPYQETVSLPLIHWESRQILLLFFPLVEDAEGYSLKKYLGEHFPACGGTRRQRCQDRAEGACARLLVNVTSDGRAGVCIESHIHRSCW